MALREALKSLQANIWLGISKLNPDVIAFIDPESFKLLSLDDLATLTSEQSQHISRVQLNALDEKQVRALSGDALSGLQAKVISEYQHLEWFRSLEFLRPAVVSRLTHAQMASFSMAQLRQLNAQGLTAEQLTSQTNAGWIIAQGLALEQVQRLVAATIESLNATVLHTQLFTGRHLIEVLLEDQVSKLTSRQFSWLDQWQIALLTGAGLNSIQLAYKTANGKIVLENMEADQIGCLQAETIAKLTIDQLALTANTGKVVLAHLTPTQIGNISFDVVAEMSVDQIESKHAGNQAVLSAMTRSQIQRIALTVVSQLSGASLGSLTMGDLSIIQISKITGLQFAELDAVGISKLNAEGLTNQQLKYKIADGDTVLKHLGAAQVWALSKQVVENFSVDQLGSSHSGAPLELLSPILSTLSKVQIPYLTSVQLASLTGAQLRQIKCSDGLSIEQLRVTDREGKAVLLELEMSQVHWIQSSIVQNFDIAELQSIITKLTPQQAASISIQQIQQMSPEAFASMSIEQLKKLSFRAYGAISEAQIKKLSGDQLAGMLGGTTADKYLSSNTIQAISTTQIQKIKSADFASFAPSFLNSLNNTVFQEINAEQFQRIASSRIAALTSDKLAIAIPLLLPEQAAEISGAQIRALSLNAVGELVDLLTTTYRSSVSGTAITTALETVITNVGREIRKDIFGKLINDGGLFVALNDVIKRGIADMLSSRALTQTEQANLRRNSGWSIASGWGRIDPLTALEKIAGKVFAENTKPNYIISSDVLYDVEKAGYSGKNIVIADIGSGVDTKNSNIYHDISEYSRNFVRGASSVLDVNAIDDEDGSGTGTAGILHTRTYNMQGAAVDAKLMVLKAYDTAKNQDHNTMASAVYYAVEKGANVINISVESELTQPLLDAIDFAARNGVIVSLGVSGTSVDMGYLAKYARNGSNVIVVGANNVRDDALMDLSGLAGSTAPYNFVTALGDHVLAYEVKGGQIFREGNGVASTFVAAEAANLLSANKELGLNKTSNEIVAAMISSTRSLY